MESVNTAGPKPTNNRLGILYPVMLIAAIALIVFSVVGIATMVGWMPGALSGADPEAQPAAAPAAKQPVARPRAMPAAVGPCNDCGVIESVRAVESKGDEAAQPALSLGQKVRVTGRGLVAAS